MQEALCYPTWLHILAVLVNIRAAGFGQQHVIPEVVHLHLLEVEDLILALLHKLYALWSNAFHVSEELAAVHDGKSPDSLPRPDRKN